MGSIPGTSPSFFYSKNPKRTKLTAGAYILCIDTYIYLYFPSISPRSCFSLSWTVAGHPAKATEERRYSQSVPTSPRCGSRREIYMWVKKARTPVFFSYIAKMAPALICRGILDGVFLHAMSSIHLHMCVFANCSNRNTIIAMTTGPLSWVIKFFVEKIS